MGVALGVALLTAVFLGFNGALSPAGYADGLRPALLVGMAVVGLGTVAAMFMPKKP